MSPPLSRAAFTVAAWGVYLFALGLGLLLVPGLLLALLRMQPTEEVWIRVLGVIVLNLGVYYWFAARSEARPFFHATVFTRGFVLVAFAALVALGLAEPALLLVGAVDVAGALWTRAALRH